MIESIDDIIRRKGDRWHVITSDPVLRSFLAPGGDYTFLARNPGVLDEPEPSGGNAISWEAQDDVVVLTHDFVPRAVCRIRRPVLERAVALLARARGVTQPSVPEPTTARSKRKGKPAVASVRAVKKATAKRLRRAEKRARARGA